MKKQRANTEYTPTIPELRKVDSAELGVQGHSWLPRKFEANMSYIKPCLKKGAGPVSRAIRVPCTPNTVLQACQEVLEPMPAGKSPEFQEWDSLSVPAILSNWLETLWGLNAVYNDFKAEQLQPLVCDVC